MDRRREAILQTGVAQKPNAGLYHFLTVATKMAAASHEQLFPISKMIQ